MKQIKVLIVDDNMIIRMRLKDILSADEDIIVIGEACNGKEAISMTKELSPDIVTIDIEMPEMGGVETIGTIMNTSYALPILAISSVKDAEDAEIAYQAISKGALEVLPKNKIDFSHSEELIEKIKLLANVKVIRHLNLKHSTSSNKPKKSFQPKNDFDKVLAIACSTGGPKALTTILPQLPAGFPKPIVIAQHITTGFINGLAQCLNRVSQLNVTVAKAGEKIATGNVYLSPPEKNMAIDNDGRIVLLDHKPTDIYHPSCNVLLSSVAEVFGKQSVGIVLTGMGDDGVIGIEKIKDAGGQTIAQDDKSSIVYGMPKVAFESGFIDKVLPLEKIGKAMLWI